MEEPTDTPVPEPPPTEEPAEQVLRIAFDASDLSSLDPHFAAATQDRAIVDMVFNGLVRYKPGDISQFEPDLATAIPEPTMEDGHLMSTLALYPQITENTQLTR